MKSKILAYIIDQINAIAKSKYPHNMLKQQAYIIGFLAQQLAEASLKDSIILDKFKRAIDKLKQ